MIVSKLFCAVVLGALTLSSFPAAAVSLQMATPSAGTGESERLEAVDALKASGKLPTSPVFVSWGEYVSVTGEPFVPVVLYVPADSALADPSRHLTFFGGVRDTSGVNFASFELPGTLTASRGDHFVETSLKGLAPGNYRGYFGLAEGREIVALTEEELTIKGGGDPEAGAISQLILSNNVFPLDRAQSPTAPFAFGGVKVVPKADRAFKNSDELWYFFEIRNPGLAEPPPPGEDIVILTPEPPAPRIQVRLDLDGTDSTGKAVRMRAPLRDVEAIEMKGASGRYGVGSAIPLESFKPGEYKLTIKVNDTVTKESYTLSEPFRVVD